MIRKMKSDRKPALANSPMKIRTRQALRPTNVNTSPFQTPLGSTAKPHMKESKLRKEHQTMTCDLKALAKMVQDELGALSARVTGYGNKNSMSDENDNGCSLFARGRFYEAYSARRNERLRKKKQSETGDFDVDVGPKTAYNLGVKVESTKKKKVGVNSYSSIDRNQHHRYSLRSITKKPPLPPSIDEPTARKTRARRK